ncbi:MAG: hypothetical protein LBQ43_04045 [Holosporales bacterium]|jgi:NADH-quinone oxidoreductase subunit C/D|nr:hypothetical protein [Holosporales bacterium]
MLAKHKNTRKVDLYNGKISLSVRDEQILALMVNVGKCIRCVEKQVEQQHLFANMRTIGGLVPSAPLCHELAFIQGIERILEIHVSLRTRFVRIILCEGERVINHILTLGQIANSVGIFPLFMQTQHIQQRYELLCEQIILRRVPIDFFTPGGMFVNPSYEAINTWVQFFENVTSICQKINIAMIKSRLFKNRASKVAIVIPDDVSAFSLTGVAARASGVPCDMRCEDELYANFHPILSGGGDVFDRVVLLAEEITQSLDIMHKCIKELPKKSELHKSSFVDIRNQRVFFSTDDLDEEQINAAIYPMKQRYSAIESPNGEFGVSLSGDGETTLQRCKVNLPSFYILQALEHIAVGENIMDLDLILASFGLNLS